jgi:predicted nucleotidyltransferase
MTGAFGTPGRTDRRWYRPSARVRFCCPREANDSSDVDLIAEFDNKKKLTLLDMVGLENRLSELLQVKVDLTPAETMKQRVRTTADKEAVLAF